MQYEHKICMGKKSCLKSTVNFIANFAWVKIGFYWVRSPWSLVSLFCLLLRSQVAHVPLSPHPSLKNMSARAHGGMAKACFTVTKSPVNNLNGSLWMSPALSRDDTIAASPNKLQLSFWGAGGPIGALETRGNHRFFPIPPPSADQHLFKDFSHCLSHDEWCLVTIRRSFIMRWWGMRARAELQTRQVPFCSPLLFGFNSCQAERKNTFKILYAKLSTSK